MPEETEAAAHLFIRRWGEMAASWGISRTMAEIHALLYISPEPLCADDVMEQLAVSRGSTSTNLRELLNWGLILRIHQRGDRKDYFEAEKDVWCMFEIIIRERRRREVQPILETIERCAGMIEEGAKGLRGQAKKDALSGKERFTEMLDFFGLMNTVFDVTTKAGRLGLKPLIQAMSKMTR
jgi:DNA-binding transcriptional regulator GbsR (MarR family)